jgi:hypothetical protein
MLKRPLWFITEKTTLRPRTRPRQDTFAFSTYETLTEFMANSRAGAWHVVKAVDRSAIVIIIADAHMRGCDAVYLDPDAHGNGGECVFLADLLQIE